MKANESECFVPYVLTGKLSYLETSVLHTTSLKRGDWDVDELLLFPPGGSCSSKWYSHHCAVLRKSCVS